MIGIGGNNNKGDNKGGGKYDGGKGGGKKGGGKYGKMGEDGPIAFATKNFDIVDGLYNSAFLNNNPNSKMGNKTSITRVFVGNIHHDASEGEVVAVLLGAGPIESFKFGFDRAVNKKKPFAFVEYADLATAQAAIRNITGHQLRGREMILDWADKEQKDKLAKELKDAAKKQQ